MKAIVYREYGSPDVLELQEVERPEPIGDQVLVRVLASSINSWDWDLLTGTFRVASEVSANRSSPSSEPT